MNYAGESEKIPKCIKLKFVFGENFHFVEKYAHAQKKKRNFTFSKI